MAKRKKSSKTKLFALLYLIAPLAILFFLLLNDRGILKYIEMKERVTKLEQQIEKSEKQIERIQAEIDSLKRSRFKLEKTAREKYNMKRPLEKGLDVKVKKDGK